MTGGDILVASISIRLAVESIVKETKLEELAKTMGPPSSNYPVVAELGLTEGVTGYV